MTATVDDAKAGLPPPLGDDEIRAAVADDPDQAPVRTRGELAAAREQERRLDVYGVLRLCRSIGLGTPEVANRLRVPWARVLRWTRGEEEPDAEARRRLEELARDPALLTRKEETRRLAAQRLAELEAEGPERADPFGVASLRRRLGLTQAAFSDRYGVALTTLRNWEQGRAEPDGAAKVLLAAIAADPELVERAARRAGDRAFLVGEEKEVAGAA